MRASLLMFAAAALAGCATTRDDDGERRIAYQCSYGPSLTVAYSPSQARIESDSGVVTLLQRPSASGFWYESGTHSLRGSTDEITYVAGNMAPRICRAG